MTDRLITAVVFLKGGGKVHLSQPDTETVLDAVAEGLPVIGVTTKGARVVLAARSYISAVGPEPGRASDVTVPSDIFDGRGIRFDGLANLVRSFQHEHGFLSKAEPDSPVGIGVSMVPQTDWPFTVVVEVEDLASATVLVMDLRKEDDDLIWVNPASEDESITAYVRMVRAAAEAEARQMAFDTEDIGVSINEAVGVAAFTKAAGEATDDETQFEQDVSAGWDKAMRDKAHADAGPDTGTADWQVRQHVTITGGEAEGQVGTIANVLHGEAEVLTDSGAVVVAFEDLR